MLASIVALILTIFYFIGYTMAITFFEVIAESQVKPVNEYVECDYEVPLSENFQREVILITPECE